VQLKLKFSKASNLSKIKWIITIGKDLLKEKNPKNDKKKLEPTKQEILEFCDRVLEKWNKKADENTEIIFAMNTIKTSVLWTDEDALKAIWGEIFKWVYETLSEKTISQKVIETKPKTFFENSIEFWENYYKNKVNPENWLERYTILSQKYADNKDSHQKQTIYNEFLGLYNLIKKEEGKKQT